MPTISDVSAIKSQKNFTTEEPGIETNDIWQFYFHFLTSSSELDGNGYDILEGAEADEPQYQSMEYNTFSGSGITSEAQDLFELVLGLSTTQGAYDYSVFFKDVVSNLNFQSGTASTAHINIGYDVVDIDGNEVGDRPTASAYSLNYYNPEEGQLPPNYAYSTSYGAKAHGDIWLNQNFYLGWTNAGLNSLQLSSILHELGHALGLKHSDGTVLDELKYTIMSYNWFPGMVGDTKTVGGVSGVPDENNDVVMPSGLQMYDILALQEIFQNRNYTKRDDDTLYSKGHGFSPVLTNDPFIYTIWDGDGTDIIDATGYANHVKIDLRQGHFSSIGLTLDPNYNEDFEDNPNGRGEGLADDNVGIAFYAVIENAIGTDDTSQGDTLIGNAWGNVLYGGAGADKIYGDGVSFDTDPGFHADDENRPGLDADADDSGDDILLGGAGDDVLYAGKGNDVLHGGYNASEITDALGAQDASEWDPAGQFTDVNNASGDALDPITHANDGFDIANYSNYVATTAAAGIHFSYDGIDMTVEKGALINGVGQDGTDTLISIEAVIGTDQKDSFYVTGQDFDQSKKLILAGGAGYDTYILGVDSDYGVVVLDDDTGAYIEVQPWQSSMTRIGYTTFTEGGTDYIDLLFRSPDEQNPVGTVLRLDLDNIESETRLLSNTYFSLPAMVDYLTANKSEYDEQDWEATTINADALAYEIGNDTSSGGGGGVTPISDGQGGYSGMTVAPYIGSGWGSFAYGQETLHPWVLTSIDSWLIPGSNPPAYAAAVEYQTWLKGYSLAPGITPDDVRLTYDFNSDTVTLHIDSLGAGFSVTDFIDGRYIAGLALYNPAMHGLVQSGGSAFENTGLGAYEAEFEGDWSGVQTGSLGVTYWWETLSFAGGPTWNLQEDGLTFTGTSAGDYLHGRDGDLDDVLRGLAGDDDLYGYSGNDTLIGGTGNDNMFGGDGNDTYEIYPGDFTTSSGYNIGEDLNEGTDKIVLHSVDAADVRAWVDVYRNLNIQYTESDLLIVFGADANGLSDVGGRVEQIAFDDETVWDLTQGFTFTDTDDAHSSFGSNYADTLDGAGGNDNISGYDGDDTLLGGGGDDALTGNDGNDYLDGGIGDDILQGGAGNDTYVVDSAGDTVIESVNNGTDTVYASVTYTISDVDVENLTLTGTDNINGTGNASANVITGNSGNNTLNGSTGADSLIGGLGDDTYVVDNVGDVVTESADEGTDHVQSTAASFTLGANVENLTLTGTGNINGTGNSLANTLIGNTGANTLDGGAGADSMAGGSGNDVYVVDDESDAVTENASQGTDTVISSIAYTLGANVENLTLTGAANINGAGNALTNVITGNDGVNTLTGGDGNDTLDGGAGADSLIGGIGNDTYIIDADDVIFENASEGADTVKVGFTYTLADNFENVTLTGSANINATGNGVNNTLVGNSGNNTLDGGAGNDRMEGGAGDDTFIVDSTSDVVVESSNNGTDIVLASASFTLSGNVENLTLTGSSNINGTGNSLANTITGNSGNNSLSGGTGDDTLIGGDGNDSLTGGSGADVLMGGAGDDLYIIDANDTLVENAAEGIDSVQAGFSYTLGDNIENLTLTGSSSINGTGNALDNSITGNSGINVLTGGDGNDVLDGGGSADTMIGGAGDDTYIVNVAGDVVTENSGEGTDTVQSSISYTLGANVENLTLTSTALYAIGNALDNVLTGNSSANTIDGGAGADTMAGGTGNDIYIVDDAGDLVIENASSGTDTVQTYVSYTLADNVEKLIMLGYEDMDGTGNALGNSIVGNDGVNTLDGGAGTDTLTGGGGADTFVFSVASYGSVDIVTDFSTGQGDALDIRDLLDSYEPGTDVITDWVRITDVSSNSKVEVDRDGTGGSFGWTQIATLNGVTGLTDEAALVSSGNLIVS